MKIGFYCDTQGEGGVRTATGFASAMERAMSAALGAALVRANEAAPDKAKMN